MDLSGIHFHLEAVAAALPYMLIISAVVFACSAIRLTRAEKAFFGKKQLFTHIRFTFCGTLAVASIMIAFAGPFRVKGDILKEKIEAKVAIALDNSPSMGAADITAADAQALQALKLHPTRLSLCIANLSHAFAGMQGLEVVLFTFSGATDLRIGDWIMLDTNTNRTFESILYDTDPLWSGAGTDLSRIFEEANKTLKDEPSFFLLCSDGGKAGSNVSEIVIKQKVQGISRSDIGKKKIPIYTLGVGTEGVAAPIPLFRRDGKIEGFLKPFPGADDIHTEYDPVMLREIANLSGGAYLHARGLYAGRDLLRSAIWAGLQNNRSVTVQNPEDLSLPFILAGLAFFTVTSGGLQFLSLLYRS